MADPDGAHERTGGAALPELPVLQADCSRCFGLCCVLAPFSADQGFAISKPSGVPCHHLQLDDRCGIHDRLRESGWPGCTVFDCFGAGQQVAQVTYAGRSWRDHDDLGEMAAVLSVVRRLHESLAHLSEAWHRCAAADARALLERFLALVDGTPEELLGLDLDALLEEVGDTLGVASRRVRAKHPGRADLAGADLAGRDLRDHDLRGAALRGAVLIAADLRDRDLTDADLLGADVRDARVAGADLSGALFLTRTQVNAMRGDAGTRLPQGFERPDHW